MAAPRVPTVPWVCRPSAGLATTGSSREQGVRKRAVRCVLQGIIVLRVQKISSFTHAPEECTVLE